MSRRSLWPREHGAYFQLAIPLATALVARAPSLAAVALAVAACLGFLAHEPLLVMLGVRGPRLLRLDGSRARRRFAGLGAGAVIAGVAGLALAPHGTSLAAALLAVPVAAVVLLASRRAEHTLIGELIAALALTGVAAPVLVASGAAPASSLAPWSGWALGFGACVVAVHRVLARHKRPAARIDVVLAVALVALAAACVVTATATRAVVAVIAGPQVALAALLVIAAPAATRLRAIGVAIAVAACASAVLALVVG